MKNERKSSCPSIGGPRLSVQGALDAARAAGAPLSDIGELTIIIRPMDLGFCEYVGSRMQLEAEGVIPFGTQWPDGFRDIRWEATGLRFRLARQRPEGAKGARRAFFDCDNWCLQMRRIDRDAVDDYIERREKELADLKRRRTPEGELELYRQNHAYFAAVNDQQYQRFRALVPALDGTRTRRRRRAG